ncbi:zinc finger protein 708-like isoform X2 [Ptychodera flava]|uniref:zinc finger protein 708-like isoform X2 n=1 Tax=Ptychodera flava TaxID=63121 RepID=UPI00396A5AB4
MESTATCMDRELSYGETQNTSRNTNAGLCTGPWSCSADINTCGFPFSSEECSAVCEAKRNVGQLHQLGRCFEMLSKTLCQQYHDNVLSMESTSIIIQSLVQHGCITLEFTGSSEKIPEVDINQQTEHDHTENIWTAHKEFFSSAECFQRGESDILVHNLQEDKGSSQLRCESKDCKINDSELSLLKNGLSQLEQCHPYPVSCAMIDWTGKLNDHILMHTDVQSRQYESQDSHIANVGTHTGVQQHEFEEFGRTLTEKSTLMNYILINTNIGLYWCEKSGIYNGHLKYTNVKQIDFKESSKAFQERQRQNLDRRKSMHPETQSIRPYECKECGATFSQTCHLKSHMLTHTNIRPHECKECDRTFTLKQNLRRHMLTHTNIRPNECTECGKIFNQKSNLRSHMLTHANIRPYQCTECGKTFCEKSHLNSHMLTHTNIRPYECNECGKTFVVKQSLEKHMLTHSNIRPYKCNKCCRTFSQKGNLESHMLIIHTDAKPYECKECGRTFSHKSNMKSHMLTHASIRPHECKECSRTFIKKGHLKEHMLTHTNIRPHECKECGRTYKQKSYLKVHMLTHTNIRPHECKECSRAFGWIQSLKKHMLTHTNIRPHECKECGKTFSRKCHLNSHMLTHTNIRLMSAESVVEIQSEKQSELTHVDPHIYVRPSEGKYKNANTTS